MVNWVRSPNSAMNTSAKASRITAQPSTVGCRFSAAFTASAAASASSRAWSAPIAWASRSNLTPKAKNRTAASQGTRPCGRSSRSPKPRAREITVTQTRAAKAPMNTQRGRWRAARIRAMKKVLSPSSAKVMAVKLDPKAVRAESVGRTVVIPRS